MRTWKQAPALPRTPGTLQLIFATGQSLALGTSGGELTLSTTQPYSNTMPLASYGPLVPLVEPARFTNPPLGHVETVLSGLCNLLSELVATDEGAAPAERKYTAFTTGCYAVNRAYDAIKKGGTEPNYQESINTVTHCQRALATNGAQVRAVLLIHGEADHEANNSGYGADIAELQANYDADLKAITSQAADVPLFLCQMHSWTYYGEATSVIPALQLAAAVAGPDVYLVTPKYHLPYMDGRHLTPAGYRQLGEHYAVAIFDALWGGGWDCLRPTLVTRSGAVITITFAMRPGAALVLDTTRVTNPGNYGFEYTDSTSSATISAVALNSTNKVNITLNTTPTGASKKIRYAYTGIAGHWAGPTTGARGCLRDNDARYTSRHGYALQNWAVTFDEAVS